MSESDFFDFNNFSIIKFATGVLMNLSLKTQSTTAKNK